MTEEEYAAITVGTASVKGAREFNCDAVATATRRFDGPATLAVAVWDGAGNAADVAGVSSWAAEEAACVAAREGPVSGLLHVSAALANPHGEIRGPDGAMVVLTAQEGAGLTIAHIGDSRAYTWAEGTGLWLITNDHTLGQWNRDRGKPATVKEDSQLIKSVARATEIDVEVATVTGEVVVLTTDGVHKALTYDRIADMVATHHHDPATCASNLVAAAHEVRGRDDATAAVINLGKEVTA